MHDRNETPDVLFDDKIKLRDRTRTQQLIFWLAMLFWVPTMGLGIAFYFSPPFFVHTFPTLFYIWLVCGLLFVAMLPVLLIALSIQKPRRRNRADE